MAKQGLVRVPFFPQFKCLSPLHPEAPMVMSALLFWMSRGDDMSFCPVKHSYQLALHLNMELKVFNEVFELLNKEGIFEHFTRVIKPKKVTENSKDKIEERYNLKLEAVQDLLKRYGLELELKHLEHAADDSFDLYDVIDLREIPTTQCLVGTLAGEDYEKAARAVSMLCVQIMDKEYEFAQEAFASGWQLMLSVPVCSNSSETSEGHEQECKLHAEEVTFRFLQKGERAIDLGFSDGNFFLPDFNEIKNKQHITKHYRNVRPARIVCSAVMLYLAEMFPEQLKFATELPESDLEEPRQLLKRMQAYL